jgi:hypothetical protein
MPVGGWQFEPAAGETAGIVQVAPEVQETTRRSRSASSCLQLIN